MTKICDTDLRSSPNSELRERQLEEITAHHAQTPLDRLLPAQRFLKEPARHCSDARVLYVSPDAARRAGFSVPLDGSVSPALNEALLKTFAVKTFRTSQYHPAQKKGVTAWVKADRYYDVTAKGAGRAGMLGGAYVKGAGLTALAGLRGYAANPGTCPISEGVFESILGDVASNLLTQGSTEVIALIDVGDVDDKTNERQVLTVRGGNHLRPAHFMGKDDRENILSGAAMPLAADTNHALLRTTLGAAAADMTTLLAYSHARACAQKMRYRVMHGVEGVNNMGLLGQQIDFGYWSTQGRSGPTFGVEPFGLRMAKITYTDITPGAYMFRRENRNHEQVLEALDSAAAALFRLEAYPHEKNVAWLQAAGLKKDLIELVIKSHPELVRQFRKLVMEGGKWFSHGAVCLSQEEPEETSLLNVHQLLQHAPKDLAQGSLSALGIEQHLAFAWRPGGQSSAWDDPQVDKYRVGQRYQGLRKLRDFVAKFQAVYPQLMQTACSIAVANQLFDSPDAFWHATSKRAEFMGRPIRAAYRTNLRPRVESAVTNADPAELKALIQTTVADSVRDMDALMRRSPLRDLGEGACVMQERSIDGAFYGVEAQAGGGRAVTVSLSVGPEGAAEGDTLNLLAGPRLVGTGAISGSVQCRADGTKVLRFSCPAQVYDAGAISGTVARADGSICQAPYRLCFCGAGCRRRGSVAPRCAGSRGRAATAGNAQKARLLGALELPQASGPRIKRAPCQGLNGLPITAPLILPA